MKPLLSIIIPTKNRHIYLKEVISTLITISKENIEFIITDNSITNSDFKEFIQNLNDSRFKYFYIQNNISQVENSEYALSLANGKYVCFIGDDDIILDNIFDMVEEMESNEIDCMIQDPITYYWPDIKFKYTLNSQKPASFLLNKKAPKEFFVIDTEIELRKNLKKGATTIGLLPKVYHGIVKKELLDLVKKKSGFYFPGPSPDMASSVALSLYSKKTVMSLMPFTIAGKSGKSASGMGLTHTHVGGLEGKDFLPSNIIETWDQRIPKFWSCSTIWAQSAYYSLLLLNKNLKINYNYLYANLLVFEPFFKSEVLDVVNSNCTFAERVKISSIRFHLFLSRILFFFRRKFFSYDGMTTYENITTISQCYAMSKKLLNINDGEKY